MSAEMTTLDIPAFRLSLVAKVVLNSKSTFVRSLSLKGGEWEGAGHQAFSCAWSRCCRGIDPG